MRAQGNDLTGKASHVSFVIGLSPQLDAQLTVLQSSAVALLTR